jgi:hypothetical protein
MLCEGIIIYFQLVDVYTGLGLGGRHLKVFYVIGWGKLYQPAGYFDYIGSVNQSSDTVCISNTL